MVTQEHPRAWTIAETKARLPEILRLAEREGPQRIGARNSFVIVPERLWRERAQPEPAPAEPLSAEPDRMPMGQWLVANFPRIGGLEIPPDPPDREPPFAGESGGLELPSRRSNRTIPFADGAEDDDEDDEEAGA